MATTSSAEDSTPPSSSECRSVVPLTTWVLISNFKLAYNLLRRPDGTFNRHLAEFLDRKVHANSVPVDGVATMDLLLERATGVWARLFWLTQDDDEENQANRENDQMQDDIRPRENIHNGQRLKPLLVYFHGGSFVHSSANSAIYDSMCRRLVKMCRVVVLSVNFRRAPEHRYPAAYQDALTSIRWCRSAPGRQLLLEKGCDPNKCYTGGDSSGGNIAHNVSVIAARSGIPLAGTILLMPMFGGKQRTTAEMLLDGKYFVTMNDRDWYWRAFLPIGADREHPACNPFSATAPSLVDVNLPPCLVVVGGLDILHEWQFKFVHSMRAAGKNVQLLFLEQATMGFFLLPNTDLFYNLVERLKRFLHVS